MSRTGLAVALKVFEISYTELAERIGCSKQEISMWAAGKRNIPQKWLDSVLNLDEFKVFKSFVPDFLKQELDQMDEMDVYVAYYYYLIEKEGIGEDYSHPYYEKINQLQEEQDKIGMMEDIKDLLDDPVYMIILKRINILIHLKSEGRLEAIASMVKMVSEELVDPNFSTKDESDFSKELYQLLIKYDLLDEINIIRTPRQS